MAWGIIAAIIAVATSAASYIAQRQQAKKAKEAAEDAAAVQVSGHNSNRSLYAVYGRALVGSTTIWKKVTKHKAATNPPTGFKRLSSDFSAATSTGENDDYRWFYRAVAICSGPIEDITNVLIDNQSYQDDRFKVDSSDHFATNVSYGTDAGAYFSRLTEKSASEFVEWDSTKLGKGVVHAVERMFLNKKHPAFAGEPTTKYEIKGRLLYDPRLDGSIPGGLGDHRYDNPGTWTWSDNPALCLLDFLTNDEFGRGLSHTDIDLSSFQTAAGKCDELVTIPVPLTNTTGNTVVVYNPYAGTIENIANSARYTQYRPDQGDAQTTQKRFRCNVALDCDKPVKDNMQVLLNCFRAYLVNVNGELQVHMEDVASSVMSITDDDIIGGLQVSSGDRSARINRATVKFLNENRMHQPDQASWPAITSSQYTTYLNEDQGEALHQQFTIKGVTDYYQAEDIAEYIVRDSRATLTARGTFHPRCMFLVPGDVIDLTYDSASWVSKFFKVTAVNVDLMTLETSLELREYDSSVYTWNASKGNEPLGFSWTNPNVNGALTAPTISSITSAVRTNTDGSTNLVMTVNYSGIPDAATVAEVLYTINGTDDWQSMLIPNPNGTQSSVDILVAADNTLYDVRLRYRAQLADGRLMSSAEATSSHTTVTLTGTHLSTIETGATAGATSNYNIAGEVFYSDDFNDNNITRVNTTWNEIYIAGASNSIAAIGGAMGSYVWRLGDNSGNDEVWRGVDQRRAMPIERGVIYRLTMIAKKPSGTTGTYLGLNCWKGDVRNGNGAHVNTSGADVFFPQHYLLANNSSLTTSFVEYVAYFKRNTGTSASSYIAGTHTSFDNPALISGEAEYAAPLIIAQYPALTGTTEIAYVAIEEVGQDNGATRNTGALADKDTVGQFDMELYAPHRVAIAQAAGPVNVMHISNWIQIETVAITAPTTRTNTVCLVEADFSIEAYYSAHGTSQAAGQQMFCRLLANDNSAVSTEEFRLIRVRTDINATSNNWMSGSCHVSHVFRVPSSKIVSGTNTLKLQVQTLQQGWTHIYARDITLRATLMNQAE